MGLRMTYRVIDVNKALSMLYDNERLVGQVRRGLDGKWYPELPPLDDRTKAIRRLYLMDNDHQDVTVPPLPASKRRTWGPNHPDYEAAAFGADDEMGQ